MSTAKASRSHVGFWRAWGAGATLADNMADKRSADIAVFGDREGALLDLRIDISPDPVDALVKLYEQFAPLVPYYELHRLAPNGLPARGRLAEATGREIRVNPEGTSVNH